MTRNIKDIINLCLEHDVDFEVYSGVNTSKPGNAVKATMLIDLGESIRIDFGDKKHGQLVSRVHVANNHKLVVDIEELVTAITLHENENVWVVQNKKATKSSTVRIPPGSNDGVTGKLSVNGKILSEGGTSLLPDGRVFSVYTVEQKNFYTVGAPTYGGPVKPIEFYEGEPTEVRILTKQAQHKVGDTVHLFHGDFKPGIGIVFS